MTATYLTVILFFILMLLGVPVSASLILGLIVSVMVFDTYALISIVTLFYSALDSYLLVAIPLFMLAGVAMSYGGVARRIFDFSEALLSPLPGSMGAVNVMASLIFGGMSGSSVADVAGLGTLEIREMVQRNYGLKYATAITVTSSTMAVVMPPSILMIIYATIANVSVGAALAAGLVPGVVIALFLILTNTGIALKKLTVKTDVFSFRRVVNTGLSGLPALLAPAIILGGIFLGTFTPTEASAIAFIYALILGFFFYRELTTGKLYKILYEGGRTSGIVAMELAAGLLFANLMTLEGIPATLVQLMAGAEAHPFVIMLGLSGILLLAGMFLNPGFSIIVFTPLLLPIAESIGYDPLHFGVIMVMNLALGLITPPVGACLYMGSVVSGLPVEQIIGQLKPFYLLMLLLLLLIILVPQLSTGFVDLIY